MSRSSHRKKLHSNNYLVNIATRSVHSQLNRLILVRLPLALPPQTTNPSTYVSGLMHVAPIYITFESLWQGILDSPHLPTSATRSTFLNTDDNEAFTQDAKCLLSTQNARKPAVASRSQVFPRTHSLLLHLRLPGLLRARRLRADIKALTGTPDSEIEEQLDALSRDGRLAEFIAHTRKSVGSNPHVLLAYAWVLYMALFSGGRYLRAALSEAGGSRSDFWGRDPSPIRPYSVTKATPRRRRVITPEFTVHATTRPSGRPRSRSESGISKIVPGLQFFNFDGDADGEDIKLEFKRRLTEGETLLTSGEKDDVITEAEYIFKFMVEIVGDLDKVMATGKENIEAIGDLRPLKASREKIAVAHERLPERNQTIFEGQENPRTPSYLKVLVDGPVTKLVRLKGTFPTWNVVLDPLGRRNSNGESSPQISFEPGISAKNVWCLEGLWTKWLPSFVPMIFCIVLASWYYGM